MQSKALRVAAILAVTAVMLGVAPTQAIGADSPKCAKAKSLLVKYQKQGKKALAAKARSQVARYCKAPATVVAAPTGARQAVSLGTRLITADHHVEGVDAYAPYRQFKTLAGPPVNSAGDVANRSLMGSWAVAFAVPQGCDSVTATLQTGRLWNFSSYSDGAVSGYVRLSDAAGTILGSTDISIVNPKAERGQGTVELPGFSTSVTAPINPDTGGVVVYSSQVTGEGGMSTVLTDGRLSFTGNCAANITASRLGVVGTSSSKGRPNIVLRAESLYSDGQWRTATPGDYVEVDGRYFSIGQDGLVEVYAIGYWSGAATYRGGQSPMITCRASKCSAG